MLRIATFGGVQPAALAELTEVLNNLLDGQNLKRSKMGGVRTAAEIINLMKTQQEEAVITAVREFDGELAQKIIDEMFLFENPGRSGRPQHPAPASGGGLRIAAYRPQRRRAAAAREDPAQHVPACGRYPARRPANRGPVRLSQVENEQKAILLIVRRLAETGEMVIGSGDDTYV